ncbi:alpha/beta fold hydrolase [Nibribacter ruber]|uniref:Alpha/beta fold hydrolase n=1 Tax=Nibribacter ruber TaxID=2698458 RepID=A0A6P1NUH9_9BACT|nr:alpha/beta hydrolase [Nibribacter ruber]QHL86700.1 alpha/beta fold hydrolase [Nibribacter ruber]
MQDLSPVYLLSGLGADERLFHNLKLRHPAPVVIQWIRPEKQESLRNYAQRLLAQITPSEKPPILIGLSFGGMVAQEMAKLIPVKRVILLSSLADTGALPWYYRVGGFLRMQQWLPFEVAKRWPAPGYWLFGVHSKEEQKLFKSIIQDTDLHFLRWSLTQILHWRHKAQDQEVILLHGDADKVLPVPQYAHVHVLKGAEHLMVLNRAQEVSNLLNQYLD